MRLGDAALFPRPLRARCLLAAGLCLRELAVEDIQVGYDWGSVGVYRHASRSVQIRGNRRIVDVGKLYIEYLKYRSMSMHRKSRRAKQRADLFANQGIIGDDHGQIPHVLKRNPVSGSTAQKPLCGDKGAKRPAFLQ
jgi:hypothetical protein